MNLPAFFTTVRKSLFNCRMTVKQVEGCEKIIAFRDAEWPTMPDTELAYVLATVKWETGHSMQPVEEGYPLKGAALRAYQKRLRYSPFYGRGLVQITHATNYEKFGIKNDPAKALEWPTALNILFRGMIFGMFTGKKLGDYFGPSRAEWVAARAVVNGTDQAEKIADMAKKFLSALQAAETPAPKPLPEPLPPPPDLLPTPKPIPTPAPPPSISGPSAAFLLGFAAVLGWLVIVGLLLSIRAEIGRVKPDPVSPAKAVPADEATPKPVPPIRRPR